MAKYNGVKTTETRKHRKKAQDRVAEVRSALESASQALYGRSGLDTDGKITQLATAEANLEDAAEALDRALSQVRKALDAF